jgi:hypothetical protein
MNCDKGFCTCVCVCVCVCVCEGERERVTLSQRVHALYVQQHPSVYLRVCLIDRAFDSEVRSAYIC